MRKVTKEVFAAHPLDGADRWRDTVLQLWRKAKYREERYAAIELTGHKLYRAHQVPVGAARVRRDDHDRRVVGLRRRGWDPPRRATAARIPR